MYQTPEESERNLQFQQLFSMMERLIMDPTAAWNDAIDLMAEDDYEEALYRVEDLHRWMQKGGFPPAQFSSREPALKAITEIRRLLEKITSKR